MNYTIEEGSFEHAMAVMDAQGDGPDFESGEATVTEIVFDTNQIEQPVFDPFNGH